MKYCNAQNLIDVTRAPYFADPTGKEDCTAVLVRVLNDLMQRTADAVEETRKKLLALSRDLTEDAYVGLEAGKASGSTKQLFITNPEFRPASMIVYFPAGTYLVSDTVGYTVKGLGVQQSAGYVCELCQHLHFMGEGRDKTVIRLADHTPGYERGAEKAVLSIFPGDDYTRETSNCAQMNTVEDLTIDCGKGNPGAVGLHYLSSNCGRIENVTVRSEGSFCGIRFGYASEGCVRNLRVTGFEIGMDAVCTNPLILDRVDLSGNRAAGIRGKKLALNMGKCDQGLTPLVRLVPGASSRLCLYGGDALCEGESGISALSPVSRRRPSMPVNVRSGDPRDWVCVDEYGAVGDGVTECSGAIQRAMDSGRPVILFGKGQYLLNKTVRIPASVQTVDFMFCDLSAGPVLMTGQMECAFDVCGESGETLFLENLCAHEQFYGFFRCFRHSARRDVVLSDISAGMAALYFNTVPGSRVYFDNCLTMTGTYSQDALLGRSGYKPVFCGMIPVEVHGQKVYGRNLNIERADVELYNDGSEVFLDGYKTEGPGVALRSENGGKNVIRLFNGGIWVTRIENAMFELHDSTLTLSHGAAFLLPSEERLRTFARVYRGGVLQERISLDALEKAEEYGFDYRRIGEIKLG